MGLGGGGGSTTTSGVPDWAEQGLKDVFADVTQKYKDTKDDPDKIIAGLDPSQEKALTGAETDAAAKLAGTGIYDDTAMVSRDLQNVMGSQMGQAAGAGALGSARSQRAMQGALADKADQWNINRRKVVGEGLGQLGEAGTTRRAYEQQLLDAPDTAAKRYFGYLHGTGTQTTTSGGGK